MNFAEISDAAISGALIAAIMSLLGLVISKEQKTSEFRQVWIDSLRSEISRLIAHANALIDGYSTGIEITESKRMEMRPDFLGVNEALANIRLRLNRTEKLAAIVLNLIDEIDREFSVDHLPNLDNYLRVEKKLIEYSSLMLKSEWRRVKRGETLYRVLMAASVALTVAFATYFLGTYLVVYWVVICAG